MTYTPSNYPTGFLSGALDLTVPIDVSPEGKVWWVDSNSAVASDGSRAKPWATIATGILKATEYDTIIIAAGHTEALTATSFAVTKGLTIIGQGTGSRKPTFTTAVVGGVVAITDADVTISNIRLVADYTGGATNAITLDAASDYCTLDSIDCRDDAAGQEWLVHINIATTVTDLTIQNCSFIGLAGESMSRSIMFAGTTSNVRIVANYIDVDASDSVVDHDAGKATSIFVAQNMIVNHDTDATGLCIELEATSTGHVVKNVGGHEGTANNSTIYLGEAAFWNLNYGLNTVGGSAILFPAAVAIP